MLQEGETLTVECAVGKVFFFGKSMSVEAREDKPFRMYADEAEAPKRPKRKEKDRRTLKQFFQPKEQSKTFYLLQ